MSLNIEELRSFAFICKTLLAGDCPEDFVIHSLLASIEELFPKVVTKLHATGKKKYSVALNDMQTLTMKALLEHNTIKFGAYEQVLINKIISEIDKKFQREIAIKNSLKSI